MKCIVGLGNPGRMYKDTRHNIGFKAIDAFAKQHGIKLVKKNGAELGEANINGVKIFLVKPLTYMNNSGNIVSQVMKYYKIPVEDLLIIQDDVDMEFGVVKLKENSGSGGHNGIKDIERALNSKEYKRLKLGVGKDNKKETADHVLSKFNRKERKELDGILMYTNNILNDYLTTDFIKLSTKYN